MAKEEIMFLGLDFACLVESFRSKTIPDHNCFLPLFAELLGYLIVATSVVLKLPQIIRILKSRSVRGLSIVAFELEVVGYTIGLAYCISKEIPFSAYGEYLFLLIQSIILLVIIYYYASPLGKGTYAKLIVYCALAPSVFAGHIAPALFEALFAGQHAIFFFARVPQIWENHTNQSTGELSFSTCFMTFAGSLVRLFTCIEEHAPSNMTLGAVMGILLNGVIVSQILIYRGRSQSHPHAD